MRGFNQIKMNKNLTRRTSKPCSNYSQYDYIENSDCYYDINTIYPQYQSKGTCCQTNSDVSLKFKVDDNMHLILDENSCGSSLSFKIDNNEHLILN